jgi:hypothetical protein
MNKLKLVAFLCMALGIGFLISRCNRDPKPSQNLTLSDKDQAKVLIEKNKVSVATRNPDGSTKVISKYVPKHATITVEKDGTVDVNVQQFGFSADPGLGAIATSEGLSLSLDLQVMYWRRMGLNVGTGLRLGASVKNANEFMTNVVRPFVAVSYRLPWDVVSNTSVLAGYEPLHKNICAGLRIQF